MPTSLTFNATKIFRDKLISRNLKPYKVDGSFIPPTGPINYEIIQRDLEVIDSPDELINDNPFVDRLYTKNAYGPSGGYDKNINVNNVIITDKPNQGPYDANDTKIDKGSQNEFNKKNTNINLYLNPFINQGGPLSALYSVPANPALPRTEVTGQRSQQYPNFNLSNTYNPYNILLGRDSTILSQDSALQQIAAKTLKKNLEERVAREIEQRTLSRINIGGALSDPFRGVQVASGRVPAIEGDYTITRPSNPVVAAADLGLRLNGAYIPTSLIPGQYFSDDQRLPSPVGQITNAFNSAIKSIGGAIGLNLRSLSTNPSQIFINNTGSWTRNRILYNLNFNRYKPIYSLGLASDVVQSIGDAIINSSNINRTGGLYVGNETIDPSRITSPSDDIPINEFGTPDISIVYGPDKLAKEFEGQSFNFGMAGKSSTDADGSIDGGFVWTSPKYKGNAGFKVKPGGDIGSQDQEFPQISSRFEQNSSSEKEFRNGSILDKTQRIINSQPSGKKRLSHAGNAIDQVSKVFDDGYKEITKGSKVKSYLNDRGEPIIDSKKIVSENEYCRIFTKDTPYYTYNDLQKKDGLYRSKEGLSTYSILDNTFNLNISPTKTGSGQLSKSTQLKKYMFSIENLAWRTSNRPGYRVSDLPECEIGPNGGRVMWFAPYNLTFSENVQPNWNPTTFLGRPEPVYTYKDTQRTGQIGFSIIVDHPSILNLIVNRYLEREDPQKVNDIMDSFFAGCLKYDLYDLAKVYNTIPPEKLLYFQEILTTNNVDYETVTEIVDELSPNGTSQVDTNVENVNFDEYNDLSLYFDNAIPKPNTAISSYDVYYNSYKNKQSKYVGSAGTFFSQVIINNFEQIDKNGGLRKKLYDVLSKNSGSKIQITLKGSASSPAEELYNKSLSERRITAIENYLKKSIPGTSGLTNFIDNKRLIIKPEALGETTVIPISASTNSSKKNYIGDPINCNEGLNNDEKILSVKAAACRAVNLSIKYIKPPTDTSNIKKDKKNIRTETNKVKRTLVNRRKEADYRGLTKRVIRSLLSECDYFRVIESENPFIFNSMKEKIKYFNPSFHSTTPEGLNSRLTFLQQCARPGDTIPTINPDGTLTNNDAYNTAFGSPPVLVLRIGDFYNTKVLCNSLNMTYEPLVFDLNPEGIGVQPMIAKIQMGITFIGGSGLKEPIEQLQNALSFNYYANTEIYDDRAESTEDTLEFDKKFYKELQDTFQNNIPESQEEIQKNGGDAIGILNATSNTGGTINYQEIINKTQNEFNLYKNNTFNKLDEVVKNYNYGILQIYNKKRNYKEGDFFEFTNESFGTTIFGKSSDYENLIDVAYKTLINKISSDDLPIQKELRSNKNITSDLKRHFKVNLIKFLTKEIYENNYVSKLSNIDSEMSKNQTNLIEYISKLNYVMTNRDGKVSNQGEPTIYKISGETNMVSKFKDDYKLIASAMTQFVEGITKDNILTKNKDYDGPDDFVTLTDSNFKISIKGSKEKVSFGDNNEKNFYLFFSQTILDKNKLNNLINYLTKLPEFSNLTNLPGQTLNSYNTYKEMVENCLNARLELYKKEQDLATKLFEDKRPTYVTNNKLFPENTERIFDYELFESPSNDDKTRIINILYTSVNANNNKQTFNGKKKLT